jgi:hypothetical protein
MFRILVVLLAVSTLFGGQASGATPKPRAGGANQISGVEGGMNQTLFNGVIRLKLTQIRNAEPSDNLSGPDPGKKWMVFVFRCSNGLHANYIGNPTLTLNDAQDNSYASIDRFNSPVPINVIQGQAWTEKMPVEVSHDFVPVKAVLTDGANARIWKAFRVHIKATDLPAN